MGTPPPPEHRIDSLPTSVHAAQSLRAIATSLEKIVYEIEEHNRLTARIYNKESI